VILLLVMRLLVVANLLLVVRRLGMGMLRVML
jgi:hypothetical protein